MHRSSLEAASAFYQAGPGIRLFRLTLGTFQRLWPALAVRTAYRLFGTPLPPALVAAPQAVAPHGPGLGHRKILKDAEVLGKVPGLSSRP